METKDFYIQDMLDMDAAEASQDVVWRAGRVRSVYGESNGSIRVDVPFYPFVTVKKGIIGALNPAEQIESKIQNVILRAYGPSIMRLTFAPNTSDLTAPDSEMLCFAEGLQQERLSVIEREDFWEIADSKGVIRAKICRTEKPTRYWSEPIQKAHETFGVTIIPDGRSPVDFMAHDGFFPSLVDSLPLAYVERSGSPLKTAFTLHALPQEKYAGTGERFAAMNLSGHSFEMRNSDTFGANSRRAYKNIPFLLSSRPYGLFVHTPAHLRLSIADISTRSVQAVVADESLDLFFIGGGSLERILFHYRQITGFPPPVPVWSLGVWMGRMTYFSAEETLEVARKLRQGGFPSDVIHVDTGWFAMNWNCDWRFDEKRFPNPKDYIRTMRDMGFRISLWQWPRVGPNNPYHEEAKSKGYIALKKTRDPKLQSAFTEDIGFCDIDFSNPEAAEWYKKLLKPLIEMGVSVIKTDFGEEIDLAADFQGMPAVKLHNLYGLLYQKAAWEAVKEVAPDALIWARAGWAGSQRYPIHWSGDSSCTWDAMAGTIRGGLHFGLSGFAYWSHDVPGFYGVPDFMNTWPEDDLYVRWTQFGVFTSHIRYHGGQPREPYEYPAISDIVRQWWKLRYALLPYIADQCAKTTESGMPVFRAMVLHDENDPVCWNIDDQYFFGESFLVCPVMNSEGVRDIYLPEGKWVNFWTGQILEGKRWIMGKKSPLEQMPVYAAYGHKIRVYPHPVQSTGQMDMAQSIEIVFDDRYKGFCKSPLGLTITL